MTNLNNNTNAPSTKRIKLNHDEASSTQLKSFISYPQMDSVSNEQAMEAMMYYREYCESMGQDDILDDDEDEVEKERENTQKYLNEVLSILSVDDKPIEIDLNTFISSIQSTTSNKVVKKINSIQTLIPVLVSMTFLHLWLAKSEEEEETPMNKSKTSTSNPNLSYLYNSIKYFPYNAGALSVLANHLRMNRMTSLEQIYFLYNKSSENASAIRDGAISILEEKEEEEVGDADKVTEEKENEESMELKVWTEMLLLDGIAGVEYLGGEMVVVEDENEEEKIENEINQPGMECFGSEDEDDDHNDTEDAYKFGKQKPVVEGDQNEVVVMESVDKINSMIQEQELQKGNSTQDFSPSEIESTSSFMAALLSSTLGNHNDALKHLRKFRITHRIHPNIWDGAVALRKENDASSLLCEGSDKLSPDSQASFTPVLFTGSNGILPDSLYDRLCKIFHPKASFWKESNYEDRGYYSFWLDLINEKSEKSPSPKNVIEDVIKNHLLPLARKTLNKKDADAIIGAEWWTHTRPIQANLGHQLHFDTDEALLELEQKVTHPLASSVLYLTTGSQNSEMTASGSTIVFDQDPDATNVASKAYISQGTDNSFMVFPGNLLHGVLPCPGKGKKEQKNNQDETELDNRLTFMVGFWTRRVPDNMPKEREWYGPCGHLPPSTEEHSWTKEIAETYEKDSSSSHQKIDVSSKSLPTISPAWEYIAYDDADDERVPLALPPVIDHRYFVHSAPGCFRASLFKDESF